MNVHALAVLEFDAALDVVAARAGTELGREAVRELRPEDAVAWIDDELRLVEQATAFLLRNQGWGVPAIPDLREPLRQLAVEGGAWSGGALNEARVLLESSRAVRRTVLRYSADHPRLAERLQGLVKLEREEERLRKAVAPDGSLHDDASPALRRLRSDIRAERSRIVERLERFVGSLPERVRVADASVSIREGRYVIPIRREGRSDVGGIVHDESGTGATLFVEPPIAIEMMNRIRELELAEAREVHRLLRELTAMLRPHRDALRATLAALIGLDSIVARARFALDVNGHRPELVRPEQGCAVVDGRHPLLLASGAAVVPFTLELEPEERTLLVSGPNTGGKTVLLKALGLLSLLAQAGVIPPVGPGTRLPVFREVFADIGDEQSIEASLSTFSAHLQNLRDVVERADARSLVMIDEIGSGTDPAEGAALARAILRELTRRGALTVATTHLGELKQLAGAEPGIVNASLQFDPERLQPTFRLVKGVPGRSYGLAIARRLGFPAALLEVAEAERPAAERDAEELLRDLERKERELGLELGRAQAARREADTLREDVRRREEELERRERDAEKRARQEAREVLLAARREVEAAIDEVRGAADAAALEETARRARRRVEEAASEQGRAARETAREAAREAGAGAASAGSAEAAEALDVGAPVRVEATGATGTVIELRDGRATVEIRGLRVQVDAAELTPLPRDQAREQRQRAASVPAGAGWSAPEVEPVQEVDLRGLRADEVAARLEPALDAALRNDLPSLRIIHGKGTGVLRDVVSEYLAAHPRVRSFRLGEFGEGGSGVTVAEL